ncbi:FAD-dependent oxidoreductase [Actinopolymorpha sp. B17G11]|uniref:protoporphyrinogen/coproporphyrinogen oxidase n=1 Tax=Actinopolymorpha sp. B17G11 TaxID=3160861 RepID=UPI0032E4B524
MADSSAASADLVVLGAGPAGLAAAWRAARRGLSVTVLERAPSVGGMAASFEVAGVRVDHGSHRLHPATPPELLADLHGLLGSDLQTRPRHGRLRVGERWVGFPLRAAELVRALPPGLLARVARDAVTAPLRRPQADTYADVLRAGLGPALYDALYAPYARKLWGLPGDRIAGEQARRRVTADTPWKIAARMLRRSGRSQRGGAEAKGQGRVFFYPRRGFGQIVEALAEAATDAGASIRLGVAAERLSTGAGGVTIGTTDGATLRAEQVFSTIPLPVLGRIAEPRPDAALEAAEHLRFRAMVLVYVVHEGGRYSAYDAHYLPGPETPVTRISEPANYRVSVDDPADRSALCAEVPCAMGDPVWKASAEDLAEMVDDALARTGLRPAARADVELRRLPHVYPVYDLGFEQHLSALDAWALDLPRVTTFGRLGTFAHDNTHHALAMAYDAVDALSARGFDDVAWSAARERFAAHVVED